MSANLITHCPKCGTPHPIFISEISLEQLQEENQRLKEEAVCLSRILSSLSEELSKAESTAN
jgi:hypothetical protein